MLLNSLPQTASFQTADWKSDEAVASAPPIAVEILFIPLHPTSSQADLPTHGQGQHQLCVLYSLAWIAPDGPVVPGRHDASGSTLVLLQTMQTAQEEVLKDKTRMCQLWQGW